jgi:hypothetical protein
VEVNPVFQVLSCFAGPLFLYKRFKTFFAAKAFLFPVDRRRRKKPSGDSEEQIEDNNRRQKSKHNHLCYINVFFQNSLKTSPAPSICFSRLYCR